ncbi:MAG: formylmethanofuran dehydrogenase subunit E family protein [Candidatus Thermoplasmatota archaeon]|nr:formylmethanofuran dehydrogenase subunit E family protein [Candidatus Thermoplasmatota archaeon]
MKEENIPVFHVLDTESSHGRYSRNFKEIRFEDLVKFHGHACDGLYRGSYALSVALDALFPDGTVDRTDLRAVSRNSPCLGDAATYLTGARVRFGTQDVENTPGVWYIIQRISTGETVKVTEESGFFPSEISNMEVSLAALSGNQLSQGVDKLKATQDEWIKGVLLNTKPREHYHVKKIDYAWKEVQYNNKGVRTDIIFKDVI